MRLVRLSVVALFWIANSSCGPSADSFREHARDLAGDNARDCAYVMLGTDATNQERCFAESHRSQQAFIGFRQRHGVDSYIEIAFVRTSTGRYYRLFFDGNVCGAPYRTPWCRSRTDTQLCSPKITLDGTFDCALEK
jgi:hypothetical protein